MKKVERVSENDEYLTPELKNQFKEEFYNTLDELLVGREVFTRRSIKNMPSYTYYTEADEDEALLSSTQPGPLSVRHAVKILELIQTSYITKENIREGFGALRPFAKELAEKIAECEDKLFLTGGHEGWEAHGIQGLATRAGRGIHVGGKWPRDSIKDILDGWSILQQAGFYYNLPVLIGTPGVIKLLKEPLPDLRWQPKLPRTDEEIETYREYLLRQGIVSLVLESPDLYTAEGRQDNVILVVPCPDWLYYVERLSLRISWVPFDDGYMAIAKEMVAPVIPRPGCVCEIVSITT